MPEESVQAGREEEEREMIDLIIVGIVVGLAIGVAVFAAWGLDQLEN